MPRFFANVTDENNILIEGNDARHIGRSLRMKLGDDITVTCHGTDYHCTIASISDSVVTLNLVEKHACMSEPSIKLVLFQAIPKSDKFAHAVADRSGRGNQLWRFHASGSDR